MTDRRQIRELQALWGQFEADRDSDAWGRLFVQDAAYIRPDGSVTRGRAAIRESLIQRTAGRPPGRHTGHVFGPAVIRVNGDTAESATDHIAWGRSRAEAPWEIILVGRMHNQLRREAGRWYFTEVANRGYFLGDPPADRLPNITITSAQERAGMTDEDQVEEVVALWAQYESDRDAVAWSDLFAEDGRYIRPNREVAEGRAAIRKSREDRNARRAEHRHTAHICGPSVVRVNGDTAECAADYVAYAREGVEHPWTIVAIGRLHNHLVRQNGKWYLREMDNQAYFLGNPPPDRLPGVSLQ
jgi:ketosteroid isomerase-like protein